MKNVPSPVYFLAIAAGVGVPLFLVLGPDSAESGTRKGTREAGAPISSEVLEQLQQLRDENQELRGRIAGLELRPLPEARAPVGDFVSRGEFEAFQEEMRAGLAQPLASSPSPSPPLPDLKVQVADALQEVRKEENIQRAKQAREKRAAMLEERLARIGEWLGLTDYQANEMRTILQARDRHERELIGMWEAGGDPEILGQMKRTYYGEYQTSVERLLTPEQLATYRKKNPGPQAGRNGK